MYLMLVWAALLASPPVDAGTLRGDRIGESPGFPNVDVVGAGEQTRGAAKLEARVTVGKVEVDGVLEEKTARRVLARYRAQVRYCYERALRDRPDLRGRVTLSLKVEPDGMVASAEVVEDTPGDESLAACLTLRAKRWRFPAFAGTARTVIRYPVVLTTE